MLLWNDTRALVGSGSWLPGYPNSCVLGLPDFENYLRCIRNVYRAYDAYIKEEGASKQKVTKKKNSEQFDEDVVSQDRK